MKACAAALLLLFAAGVSAAHAFLGDDMATVEKRYGKAVRTIALPGGSKSYVHENEGYRVLVDYEAGRSVNEAFSKMAAPGAFSEEELRAFLRDHAGGRYWHEAGRVQGQRTWQRDGAMAVYDGKAEKPGLIIARDLTPLPPRAALKDAMADDAPPAPTPMPAPTRKPEPPPATAAAVPMADPIVVTGEDIPAPVQRPDPYESLAAPDHRPGPEPYVVKKVRNATSLEEWKSPLEADGPQKLETGHLDTGRLATGQLSTGSLSISKLQTGGLQLGGLQIGKLGDTSRGR